MKQVVRDAQAEIESELTIESMEAVFMGGNSHYLDLLLSISTDSCTGFEHGASDARFLSNLGINGIVWGANGDSSAHSLEEHVNIESVNRLFSILDEFMTGAQSLER